MDVEVEETKVTVISFANSELESSATTEDLVYMLRVVVGVMLIGYVVIGVNWLVRRRHVDCELQ